jgi:hypothetical protein
MLRWDMKFPLYFRHRTTSSTDSGPTMFASVSEGQTERFGLAVMLWVHIHVVFVSNLYRDTSYSEWGIYGFPQSLKEVQVYVLN